MSGLLSIVKPGVVTGDDVSKVFAYAKANKFAIPAINCTSTSTINAALEAAMKVKSPVIIQFSYGGAQFIAGKGLDNSQHQASILGAISGAKHVHQVAAAYGIPVMLHTDHCAKKLLPWLDGVIAESERHFKETGTALFSSHMVDLSEEHNEQNIATTKQYLERLSKINCTLEMEIGITGGEEDGVNNEHVDNTKLYTTKEDIEAVYRALTPVSDKFTIAAAFGNVHGVYAPGNVQLKPEILGEFQKHIRDTFSLGSDLPINFVFHGGSGSSASEISTALSHGVIKMNVDTDAQWGYWVGVKDFYESKKGYLQSQVGNPDGDNKPNKANYDPRVWIRAGEATMSTRVQQALADLQCINRN